MARPLRIEFPGALYHITSRGNRKSDIFNDDIDRRQFIELFAQTVERFGWHCHAYCLMDNHYHLLIETPEANLSRGMRHLNGVYTQKFNYRHMLVGHLFQGRFKAILVEKHTHLLEACRYIILNPVRAEMVSSPGKWPWSSYSATAGLLTPPKFLTRDWLLDQFGMNLRSATSRYRKFVASANLDSSPFDEVISGLILGSESFIARCRELLSGELSLEIPKRERRVGRPQLEEIFSGINLNDKNQRSKAVYEAYNSHSYRMKQIAEYLNVHYATISRDIAKIEKVKMLDCKDFSERQSQAL